MSDTESNKQDRDMAREGGGSDRANCLQTKLKTEGPSSSCIWIKNETLILQSTNY